MAPTITASVLFTDLVGSTDLLSRLGPETAEQLRREHFMCLREAIGASGGTEVKNLGDGLMVVFGSVTDAVSCAVRIQQLVDARNRRSEETLLVRVGVSVGDVDADEDDYFGAPVVEAARLCAIVAGGKILTTDLVRVLYATRGTETFEPRGQIQLKGLPEPLAAAELLWEPLNPAAVSTPLPSRLSVTAEFGFFGRAVELDRLETSFKLAAAESRRVVLISGEAGIGKTALCMQLANLAYSGGATVLYGRCEEDIGIVYQPFVEALRHLVEHAPATLLAGHVERHGGELTRLVPELTQRARHCPAPQTTEPETEQHLLFRAVAGLLAAASRDEPVVIVLDDLHWADKPSLLLLRHLISSTERLRVLVVGTYRDDDVSAKLHLHDALSTLYREPGVERIELHGIADVDLVDLMEAAAGHELDSEGVTLAHALHEETDGNPFYAVEMLRHLAESGRIYEEDGRWRVTHNASVLDLPQSVHEVVGWRVARLGDDVSQALGVAAVIGQDFDLDLLASALGDNEDRVLSLLEQAVEASLVNEIPTSPGRFSFAHALIGHTLYDGLGITRRTRLHRKVAEALEALCGDDTDARLPELAAHWCAARLPPGDERALSYAWRAGDQALDRLAPDEAVRWYTTARAVLEVQPEVDQRVCCRLLIALGEAERRAGHPQFRATLLDAARRARTLDQTDLLVEAVLANNRGTYSGSGQIDQERIDWLEIALAHIDDRDSRERSLLLALLALETIHASDWQRRLQLSDDALEMARRLGDDATIAEVLRGRYEAIRVPHTLQERLANTAEHLELAQRLDDPLQIAFAGLYRERACLEIGWMDDVKAAIDGTRLCVEASGNPYVQWALAADSCPLALLEGRVEEAEQAAFAAFEIAQAAKEPDALAVLASHLIEIRWHQGRLDELEPMLANAVEENPRIPGFRAVLAMVECELDRLDVAREVLARDRANDFADFRLDPFWLVAVCYLAEAYAHLRDPHAAAIIYDLLEPWHEQIGVSGAAVSGGVARHLGLMATVLARYDDAERHFAEASGLHDRIGGAPYLARTYLEWARMLGERGDDDDYQRAIELIEDATRIASEHSLTNIARHTARVKESIPNA